MEDQQQEFKKYRVLEEFTAPTVDDKPEEVFVVGQEVEMPADTAAALVKEGLLELVVEENKEENVPDQNTDSATGDVKLPEEQVQEAVVPSAPTVPVTAAPKSYMGKQILSEKIEIVNEKEYHSLKFADGSTQLLSPAEYEEAMK